MATPQFIIADIEQHHAELLALNTEYLTWLFAELNATFNTRIQDSMGTPSEYAQAKLPDVCTQQPPEGVFYLVMVEEQLAGIGGLRGITADVAEIKRIYIRPALRGEHLGEQILSRLLKDARRFGYESVRLDTGPFMKAAHRLYENADFVDRPPYAEAEVPAQFHDRWRFMEKSLLSND